MGKCGRERSSEFKRGVAKAMAVLHGTGEPQCRRRGSVLRCEVYKCPPVTIWETLSHPAPCSPAPHFHPHHYSLSLTDEAGAHEPSAEAREASTASSWSHRRRHAKLSSDDFESVQLLSRGGSYGVKGCMHRRHRLGAESSVPAHVFACILTRSSLCSRNSPASCKAHCQRPVGIRAKCVSRHAVRP